MTKTPEELAEEYRDRLLQNGERMNVFETFLDGYKAAQQWISVKDRLPEDGREVLVFEEGTISTNCYSYNPVPSHRWDLYPNGFNCNPSHWMPLPEPPKEEK